MEKKSARGTSSDRIASKAKVWRQRDRVAIADRRDDDKQRAEFDARQKLREVIDQAGAQP